MSQRMRIGIAVLILVVVAGFILGVDYLRRGPLSSAASGPATLIPGSIPIYLNGNLVAGLTPDDLGKLKKVSFVEPVEGKTQEGWLLRDILLLYIPADRFTADTQITVSSSSRGKTAQLTWPEVDDAANMVMFDLSNRGTLKLVSKLPQLSTREQWVQDTDRVEVTIK